MSIKLTSEQQDCVHLANSGHNFAIYGEAGTGKSIVVSSISKNKGKNVQVVCSTGIACEVFKGDENLFHRPVTVHSYFGIRTAQGPFDAIVKNACENVAVEKRILKLKCVLWDECSMGSARLVELLHAICSKVRNDRRPFGGIQVILVGDWLQLKPVRDRFDDGVPMYLSPLFGYLFPHTVQLTVVHRQKADERKLLDILKRIRLGRCEEETTRDLQSLSRPINEDDDTVHLYFTNSMVDGHNTARLSEFSGERALFRATDTGDIRRMQCPAPDVCKFKPGAPVMVLYNVNDRIHNGTRAFFVRKLDDKSAVIEVDGAEHTITNVTWTNVDKEGHPIGSRYQIPLKLYWAATVHKSQGLTLKKAIIHSYYEFTGGLLYTALSRVRTIDNLQVLGFKAMHVQNRDSQLQELRGLPCCSLENCPCWREVPCLEFQCVPVQEELSDELIQEIAEGMFEGNENGHDDNGQDLRVNMEEYLEAIDEEEHVLSNLPEDFSVNQFLESSRPAVLGTVTEFVTLKNDAVDSALQNVDKFSSLLQIVWFKTYLLLRQHLKANLQNIALSMKELTAFYHQVADISKSAEYRGWLKFCFSVQELTPGQISVGFDVVVGVYHNVLDVLAQACKERLRNDIVTMKVREMDSAGKGKIRFVGAWAISKILKKARKYVRDNMNSEDNNTLLHVKQNLRKAQLLEEVIVIPYEILCSLTTCPQTLNVTEVRQYRTHGLIHVSDEYFEFVLELEQRRIELLNAQMFKIHGENLIEIVEDSLVNDDVLSSRWKIMFPTDSVEDVLLVEIMYTELIKRYINVGANQFVKDFRSKWQVKKAMAHRQMVLARKEKKVRNEAKVPYSDIVDDNSLNKERSHNLLKALLTKFGDAILAQLYTRKELLLLQKGYGLPAKSSHNKALLGKDLAQAILSQPNIPYPWSLETELQALPLERGGLGFRIRRVQRQ